MRHVLLWKMSQKAINGKAVSREFLVFIVLNNPEKLLKFASVIRVGTLRTGIVLSL